MEYQELSSIEIQFLSKEMESLQDGKFEKAYQWGKEEFIFRFYTKEAKKHLRVVIPGLAHFTTKKYAAPKIPPGYCSFLRKYTTNAYVRKAYQYEFERVLVLELESKIHGFMTLIIEFLKPGNVVLCRNENGKLIVMNPLKTEKFKDREVAAKKEYSFPIGQPDTKSMGLNELKEKLLASERTTVKCLATELGFGGVYAEEIVMRSGARKDLLPRELSQKEIDSLAENAKNIFLEKPSPFYYKGRVYPFNMKSVKGKEKEFGSFSEGLDEYFFPEKIVSQESSATKTKGKASAIISAQEKNLKKFEKDTKENQRAGELIYENYSFFSEILEKIRVMREEKRPWSEIKEYLETVPGFKSLDVKEKKLVFEIKEK